MAALAMSLKKVGPLSSVDIRYCTFMGHIRVVFKGHFRVV
jgi:hypothetical protein